MTDGILRGTEGKSYKIVACTVRNNGSGFEFISDTGHVPVGCLSVTTAADQSSFTINYSFTANRVVSMVATPDETLAKKGFTFGASVGLALAKISAGQPGGFGDYVSWDGTKWTSLHGYVTDVSMNPETGLITCTHQVMDSPISGSVVSRSLTKRASLEGLGTNTTSLFLVDSAGVPVKTPTKDNRFWISRAGSRQVKMDELDLASANIWIYGVFEVL